MENISIKEFYKEIIGENGSQLDIFLETNSSNNLGHFNPNFAVDLSCKTKWQFCIFNK
jgi:hypothetical protein